VGREISGPPTGTDRSSRSPDPPTLQIMAWDRCALRRLASLAGVLLASVLLVQGVPGAASAESVAQARQEAARLKAELADLRDRSDEAIVRLEEAETALGRAIGRSATLTRQLDAARKTAGGSDRQLQRRVSALYRSGGQIGLWASLLGASSPAEYAAMKANVDMVVATDVQLRDAAADAAGQIAELEQQAADATAEQLRATAVAETYAAELTDLIAAQEAALARASQRVRDLVEAERRAAAAAAAARLAAEQAALLRRAQLGGLGSGAGSDPSASYDVYVGPAGACPVGPVHSFTDTWHASRSGGRLHKGTDVFAPYGAPAYAVVDGVIERWSNGGLGGIALWLRGDNGDRYYYAHNTQNVAPAGSRVQAGQLVAYVGTTGNAATTPPHIHFEAHPASVGESRNPYPWLAALCGRR
jgi:murein DD-endopeptidase MepM/ murein hydrolase activator NlpD